VIYVVACATLEYFGEFTNGGSDLVFISANVSHIFCIFSHIIGTHAICRDKIKLCWKSTAWVINHCRLQNQGE